MQGTYYETDRFATLIGILILYAIIYYGVILPTGKENERKKKERHQVSQKDTE